MQPIEVRYIKKLLFPLILFATIFLTGMTIYLLFFSAEYKDNNPAKIIHVATFLLFGFFLFGSWQTILNKKPVMVFKDSELIIYKRGKPFSFNWSKITYWKVEKLEDNKGYLLLVETGVHKEKISLNWLDKPPQEIERLMSLYVRGIGNEKS